ncbi:MAG: peptidoglycan DD-metalloendopeptidase family protein [Ilumatobacter sp.]|uniref:peptidoglycan DD-metalloendopeptidase family protein n=1 Tax=Ilumatobacter sp. TaxID=1967498 RepID=UPI0032972B60
MTTTTRPTPIRPTRRPLSRRGTWKKASLGLSLIAISMTSIPATTAAAPPMIAAGLDGADDLGPGDIGPRVKDVQQALVAGGVFLPGGVDGVFGSATTKAIADFQSWNGLERTGELDEQTIGRLERVSSGAASSRSRSGGSESDSTDATGSDATGWTSLERFPVQGNCAYGDTWHASRGGGRVHEGVDVIAATGNLLYAVADGTITTRYWDQPGRISGNGLKLTAADGTYFVYLHLSGFAPGIEVGTRVEAGDVIGFVGSTGSSATPHLHFEIHPGGGGAINPYPYVRAIDDCSDLRARYQSSFD